VPTSQPPRAAAGSAADAELEGGSASGGSSAATLRLPRVEASSEWALTPDRFRAGLVGGKSLGVQQLAALAGANFSVPPAFAIPYGAFEHALATSSHEVRTCFSDALAALNAAAPPPPAHIDMGPLRNALAAVRHAASEVTLPGELQAAIGAAVSGQGESLAVWSDIADDSAHESDDSASSAGTDAWRAIKAVWASKWTERAFLNRRARGVPEHDLSMAVLCMGLVPAEYAFVLHTQSPLAGASSDEVFGEVVVGLGETLVGNSPGRAFSFSAPKSGAGDVALIALPSKLEAHFAPDGGACLIARSDSNGEDLEGYAGAGLYESHTTRATKTQATNYAAERLLWDASFRGDLVKKLVELAKVVERSAGCAQDIEGCMVGDKVYLLQSRAQI
jgi:alpha-glucan, water dikinase